MPAHSLLLTKAESTHRPWCAIWYEAGQDALCRGFDSDEQRCRLSATGQGRSRLSRRVIGATDNTERTQRCYPLCQWTAPSACVPGKRLALALHGSSVFGERGSRSGCSVWQTLELLGSRESPGNEPEHNATGNIAVVGHGSSRICRGYRSRVGTEPRISWPTWRGAQFQERHRHLHEVSTISRSCEEHITYHCMLSHVDAGSAELLPLEHRPPCDLVDLHPPLAMLTSAEDS